MQAGPGPGSEGPIRFASAWVFVDDALHHQGRPPVKITGGAISTIGNFKKSVCPVARRLLETTQVLLWQIFSNRVSYTGFHKVCSGSLFFSVREGAGLREREHRPP